MANLQTLKTNHYKSQLIPNKKLTINNEIVEPSIKDGYFEVTRNWNEGDTIEISFPMEVRTVKANEKVKENRGKLSLEYGPIVYAVEEVDNPKFDKISISTLDEFTVQKENILEGVNTITNDKLKAIPYYSWSNRGVGKMKVWINNEEKR